MKNLVKKASKIAKNSALMLALLAPAKAIQTPITGIPREKTLVLYEKTPKSEVQKRLLEEVKKRYGNMADFVPFNPEEEPPRFKRLNLNKPKQVLFFLDYRSVDEKLIEKANQYVRNLDDDPFPDARLSIFPAFPGHEKEQKRLIRRLPYKTKSPLSRARLWGFEWLFAKTAANFDYYYPRFLFKKDGIIESTKDVTHQHEKFKSFLDDADYVSLMGETFIDAEYRNTLEVFERLNGFVFLGINEKLYLLPVNSKYFKPYPDKSSNVKAYSSLEEIVEKYEIIEKECSVSTETEKIVEYWGGMRINQIENRFQSLRFSKIMPWLISGNAYVWINNNIFRDGGCSSSEDEFFDHPFIIGRKQRDYFWAHGKAHTFTNAILASSIANDIILECLKKGKEEFDFIYSSNIAHKNQGAYFGLPDPLTKPEVENFILSQKIERKIKKNETRALEISVSFAPQEKLIRREYNFIYSPPVIFFGEEINPMEIKRVFAKVGKRYVSSKKIPRKDLRCMEVRFYDPWLNRESRWFILDNAAVLYQGKKISPYTRKNKNPFPRIKTGMKYAIKFDA